MKKEPLIAIAIALLIFSSVLDLLTGPVTLTLRQPFAFLRTSVLTVYPLTAASILVKTLGLWLSVLILLSLIKRQYLIKAIVLLVAASVAELYSLQQLTTKGRLTSLEWTLAIAYCGVILALPLIYYLVRAFIDFLTSQPEETPPASPPPPDYPPRTTHLKPL